MKFKLTWHDARKCWKKFSGGKTFYLGKGKCQGKFDYAGYNAALAEWQKLSGEMKAQAKADEIMESDPAMQDKIDMAQQRRRYLEKEYPDKSENEAMEIDDALSSKNKGSKRDKINQIWTDWSSGQRIKNNKGLKAIRKTSATKLGENSKYARFSQYFLAQSPKTVADKHYVQPSQSEFNKALAWLGKQYEK